MSRPVGIDWDAQPLGRVPDREIARTLGVSQVSVHGARSRRGIPAFRSATVVRRIELPRPVLDALDAAARWEDVSREDVAVRVLSEWAGVLA